MGVLMGILGISDVDTRLATLEQSTIYDAVREVTARYQRDRDAALSFFVERTTTEFQETYKLPGGEEMQELGQMGTAAEQRPTSSWQVAYPLKKYGTAIGWDDETYAYMKAEDLDNLYQSAVISNARTHRKQIMRALFGNADYTYKDKRHGDLTVRRLANGDGATYPPFLYATVEADDNHYIETGYLASAISDAQNPLTLVRDNIRHHWEGPYQLVALINSAQTAKIKALVEFVDADVPGIDPGVNVSRASGASVTVPGTFIGVDGATGVRVYEYDHVPANYIYGTDVNREPPLIKREHIPEELKGFKLAYENDNDPLHKRTWIDRFGYATGNRLNGLVIELGNGGTYTIPAALA